MNIKYLCRIFISLFLASALLLVACSKEAKYASAIENVLLEDSNIATENSTNIEIASRMKKIDTSDCQEAFRLAYYNHINAWERAEDDEKRWGYNDIGTSFSNVERSALKYKAKLVEQMK